MRYSPWTSQDAEQVMISRSFITSTCTSSASDGVEATAVRNCTGSWYSASSSFSDRKRSSEINFWRPFMAWRESLLDLDSNASLSGRKHFSLSSCGCNFRVPFRLMNKPSERTKNGPSQGAFLQTHFLEFRSNCMKLTSSRYTRVPHRLCFIRRGIVSKVGQHLLHNVSNPWDPCWCRNILPLWRQLFPFEHQHYLYRDLFFQVTIFWSSRLSSGAHGLQLQTIEEEENGDALFACAVGCAVQWHPQRSCQSTSNLDKQRRRRTRSIVYFTPCANSGFQLFSFPNSDHLMFSWHFSLYFFFFISYTSISTCLRWHLKETVSESEITWSEMTK